MGRSGFQSSPAPKSGCNSSGFVSIASISEFQSSPAPKSGCNTPMKQVVHRCQMFQSSPAPKSGCNQMESYDQSKDYTVSILTRSEERVQLCMLIVSVRRWHVSILTRSEERVQQ